MPDQLPETIQFHDPATKDVHEKRMFDLRMGKNSAISYFNKLEIEAKKARQRGDDQARGLMVKTVRLRVPDSYTNAITSFSENIPVSYNDWKRRILQMYEERQKKWVFDQTLGNSRGNNLQKGYGTTTTSTSQKAGGATSSSLAKPMSSANPPWDSAMGRWHPVKTVTVDEYTNDDTDTPLKGSNDGLPARAEAKAANPAGHKAESLSMLHDSGANRPMSSS
ncbi:uncharacterized protein ARMOST_03169 [Armillaria ostoyae]|uniref:Retrotransposon gag domain-containing protein n=1 Tax=Armillaria ostoyae TaxID=47428 RepID=A0A284QTQ4_ARMOS|nr:uncharacterized protein ARMOST_03169 [Armillaria ostoyae]